MNNENSDQAPALVDWWHQQLYSLMSVVMASYAIVWLFLCTLVMGGRASRPTDYTPRLSLTNAKRWMGVVIGVALLECAVNYLVVLHFSNTDTGDYCCFFLLIRILHSTRCLLFVCQSPVFWFLFSHSNAKNSQRMADSGSHAHMRVCKSRSCSLHDAQRRL